MALTSNEGEPIRGLISSVYRARVATTWTTSTKETSTACSSFREENEQLFSLVRNLPVPELDLGLFLELEALLQVERATEALQNEYATKTDLSHINSGPLSRKVVINNTNGFFARYFQPRLH